MNAKEIVSLSELAKRWNMGPKNIIKVAIKKPTGKPALELLFWKGRIFITKSSIEAWESKIRPDTWSESP